MVQYTKSMLTNYGLSKANYREIVATAHEDACMGYDSITGEYIAGIIAEAVAHDLDHDEWLDDETHPVWDIAADVAEQMEG